MGAEENAASTRATLVHVLESSLRLLHPFMPFVTEEIWQSFPHSGETIVTAPFPAPDEDYDDPAVEEEMSWVVDAVSAIRSIRGEMSISPSQRLRALIRTEGKPVDILEASRSLLETLARADVEIGPQVKKPEKSATEVRPPLEVYVPLEGLVDIGAEIERLRKDLTRLEGEAAKIGKKLNNEDFLSRAPEDVVTKEKAKHEEVKARMDKVRESMDRIRKLESS